MAPEEAVGKTTETRRITIACVVRSIYVVELGDPFDMAM